MTSIYKFRIGERVRLRTTGEDLKVAKYAGSLDRPRLVCTAADPDSDWRICAPEDLEAVAYDPTAEPGTPPVNLAPAAALATLAQEMDFMGHHEWAEQARAIVPYFGYLVVAVDTARAEATMLAAYAPGVQVEARTTGDRLLTVVGEQ
ncbi:hypothetical protein [Nocardia sp. NBC_01009]|uniref:hypothetical protein n=1 Tax=Nocardia sp. NBC_01009 TaxID=2975996 RepID=UPI0038650EF6|nr:hypothetical protein OHA42_05080 [Nocardia sp. NBC_01009]